ncbi:MAG TPA: HD-GYP domain-containing protein [Tepidisphaeraceae bacterium]|jgi:HD-GYP domain-containing protein (c-di-GMP phosphodiesterase class II)
MNANTLEKYRPIHNSLAERCASMGVAVWFFDNTGKPVPHAGENAWLQSAPELLGTTAQQIAATTLATRQSVEQLRDGVWWIPLVYTQGSQIVAVSVAAILAGGELRRSVLKAAADLRHAKDILLHLPARRTAHQLVKTVQWMHADLCAARRHGSMLDEFSEQLSQAFEELNLVFRMSHLLNSTHAPQDIVQGMCDELRKSLSFGWVCIHFCASRDAVPELTSRILFSGNPPGGADATIGICTQISRDWSDSAATKILRPERDPLARQCEAEVLVQPVLHDGRPVALIFAGNKQSADSDVCSIEIQMLQAAARFMGMAHQNMSRFSEQRQMFLGTVQSLTAAVDAKDSYTRGHSERVGMLARQMAEALALEPEVIHQYYVAGLLHDVGKIGIPEAVLGKTGRLTDAEFDVIKKHPEIGYRILTGIPSLDNILPGVLHHHERWDGHGYPHGLMGEKIPFIARVLCVCDTFDAMNSRRSYRDNLPRAHTIAELQRVAGSQFDPALVPVFLNMDLTQYDRAVAESEGALAKAA